MQYCLGENLDRVFITISLTRQKMETISSENDADKTISFSVILHYPDGEGADESLSSVAIDSSASLSALAAKILQQLYQRGKVDGNQILKAKNVKGMCSQSTDI